MHSVSPFSRSFSLSSCLIWCFSVKVVLGVFLIVGTVLASLFGWIHVPPVMAVGDILVILATILALWGILRTKVEG